MKKNILLLFIFLWLPATIFYTNGGSFEDRLPSEETMGEMNDLPSNNTLKGLKVDWGGAENGPPTEGGGQGGHVGAPIGDGIVPIALSALVYLSVIFIRRKKTLVQKID